MNLSEVAAPTVSSGKGFSALYTLFLRCITWAMRTFLYYQTPACKLFDAVLIVDTPLLGTGQVQVSICVPRSALESTTPRPLILVAEGGGFIAGQPKDGGAFDRWLSDKLNAVVISTEYAKTPQYPFPHALLQLHEVLKWALLPSPASAIGATIDPSRVAALGMSAGGNLTASLMMLESFSSGPCAQFRNELPSELRFTGQALLYPYLPSSKTYRERWEACNEATQTKSFPTWVANIMDNGYMPPYVDRDSIFTSPAKASVRLLEQLSLPDSLVITAGLDALKAEADEYAANLKAAKVRVLEHDYPKAVHGFTQLGGGVSGCQEEDIEGWRELVANFLQHGFQKED